MSFLKAIDTRYKTVAGITLPGGQVWDKQRRAVEQVQKALEVGKIAAQDKADFQKAAAEYFKAVNSTGFLWQIFRSEDFKKDYPGYEIILTTDIKKDAAKKLAFLKSISLKPEYHINSLDSLIENTETAIALLDLLGKVKNLDVEGEIVKKVKEDLTKTAPASKLFPSYDFLKYYTPKYQRMVLDAIPAMEKSMEQGWIANKDLRSWGAIFNKHSTPGVKAYDLHLSGDKMYGEDSNSPAANEVKKVFKPVQEVFQKLNELRDEKEQKEIVYKDRSWSPAADILEKKLHGIIEGTIDELKTHLFEGNVQEAKHYWKTIEDNKFTKRTDYSQYLRKTYPSGTVAIDRDILNLFEVTEPGQYEASFTKTFPTQKVDDWAKLKGDKAADQIAKHFVSKNLYKLAPLLKMKPLKEIKVYDVTVARGAVHSTMSFTFEDASSFVVQNKIVYGVSKYGTWFARYPTTFHNVKIKGEPMKSPSEDRVYKEFSGETAPKEKAESKFLNKIKAL